MEEAEVKGDQIRVYMETDLGSLRAMLAAADLALKTWPGGDPQAVSYTHLTLPTILLV